ncbi:MAG: hydrogenase iron-sulfur subunit [Myxococcota bacterium]|nr:hydrogenase iron-sulfur subunit [Myxococcota bacterium]
MSTATEFRPKLLGIACNWCCYGGADLCGVSRFQYAPYIRLLRVMCSGRVDFSHIFRAFADGLDGVFVGGCHINDCHYVTQGNYDAYALFQTCKRILEHIGLDPERLRLEWVSAGEGIRFAEIMNDYGARMQKRGPLGKAEGLDDGELRLRLRAVLRIVPYLRLVQAQRLQAPVRTEEECYRYFRTETFDRLCRELVLDVVTSSRILLELGAGPLPAAALSERLGLGPSELARHLRRSANLGLVRYDMNRGGYSAA